MSRSTRPTHGVLVEHQRVLSQKNLHGAPSRLAPQHSWYILWNLTAGTLSRSIRSTHGVLVEQQWVLGTAESPRGAYQAVLRKPRSRGTRVSACQHNRWQHETWSGGCTDPSPEARTLGSVRRCSFFRPVCASQGSLLLLTSACSSASPGAACPKCPPLRTDQKKKPPPPIGGRGGVLRKVLKSGLDFAPV